MTKPNGKLRRIHGVGINDADYNVCIGPAGKQVTDPYYAAWANMLLRCYSPKCHSKYPNYADCTVCDEWVYFSNFKAWMDTQEWKGKQLDKDIIAKGNKLYSPDTCFFVTPQINTLFIDRAVERGEYPLGVRERGGRYQARCNHNDTNVCLGTYDTPEHASTAYQLFKYQLIKEAAYEQDDLRLRAVMLEYDLA